jgi:PAS domain S-box-containing protein
VSQMHVWRYRKLGNLLEGLERLTSRFSGSRLVWRYGLALLITAAGFSARVNLSLDNESAYLILVALVLMSGVLAGFGPGLVATLLLALAEYYYFVPPALSFAAEKQNAQTLISWGGFVILGACINLILLANRLNRSKSTTSERRSRDIFQVAPMGVFLTDNDGNCLFANQRWCEWAGMTLDEAQGKGWLKALHPDDRARVLEEWSSAVREGREFNSEYRFITSSGRVTWLLVRATTREEAGEQGGFVGMVQDISERKLAEEKLKSTNERLELAQKAGSIGTFDWDIRAGTVTWSEQLEDLFGLESGSFGSRFESWVAGLHPEDREETERAVWEAVNHGKELNVEFRIPMPYGGERWIAAKAEVYHDDKGQPLRMIGINQDVTVRKQTERALKFLSGASRVLSSSLNYEATLNNVIKLAVPELADWCTIDMLDDQGHIRRVAQGYGDRVNRQIARRLELHQSVKFESNSVKANVLRTGEPVLYEELTSELIGRLSDDQARVELMEQLRLSSVIIVPIQILGWAAGTITLALVGSPRRYSENDLALARGLSERAATAIDNAWLYRETKSARDELEDRVKERTQELSQLALIVEASDDAIIGKTVEGVITSWNMGATQIYGFDETEVVGKSVDLIIPADKPNELTEILARLRKGEHIKSYETERIRKDGRRIFVSLTISPVRDLTGKVVGASTISRDITRRRQAEIELAYSQMRLEEAQQIAGLGSWEWDLNTNKLKWSGQMYRLFGVDKSKFEPQYDTIASFTHPDDRDRAAKEVRRAVENPGAVFSFEYRIIRRDNRVVDLYAQGRSVADASGKVGRLVGTVLDITERKRVEGMKADFVSLVSHQLKTPLAIIKGYTDNMLIGIAGKLTQKQEQYMREMGEIVAKYYFLIADLLNVSRIERGVISVDIRPVRLKDVVDGVIHSHRDRIDQKSLKLVIESDNDEVMVMADKEKMAEAISNIMDNAIKFTDSGAITLRINSEQGKGIVVVEDSGKGMDEATLTKLFKKDQIFSGSPKPEGGSGLGLYIANEFMNYQNGSISVWSAPGVGSKFTFAVPLAKVKARV